MKKKLLLMIMVLGISLLCVACEETNKKPSESTSSEIESDTERLETETLIWTDTELGTDIGVEPGTDDEPEPDIGILEPEPDVDVSGMRELTREELDWFEAFFFNDDYNWFPMMFLSSEYKSPLDVDLGILFYNGFFLGHESATKEECQLLIERFDIELWGDVTRMPLEEMNKVLRKYISLTLEETHKVGFDFYYLEEYQSYYNIATDAIGMSYVYIKKGWKNEEGTIVLTYSVNEFDNEIWQVILHEEDGEYYFVANIRLWEQQESWGKNDVIYGYE